MIKRQREQPTRADSAGEGTARSLANAADAAALLDQIGLSASPWSHRFESLLSASYAREIPSSTELEPDWDSGRCTFETTGMPGAPQTMVRCLTCAMDRVCAGCCRSCHAGHAVVLLDAGGGAPTCQCGASGKCSASNSLRVPEPDQDEAGAIAEACEAVLCWGCGEDLLRSGLQAACDHLGFVELTALITLAQRHLLPPTPAGSAPVALSSVVTALQRRGLCRFRRIGSAAVAVSPRHPHAPRVVYLAARHIEDACTALNSSQAAAESSCGAGSSGIEASLDLSRAATLPDTLGASTLLGSASTIQHMATADRAAFGGPTKRPSHLRMDALTAYGGQVMAAVRNRLASRVRAAEWTSQQWREFFVSSSAASQARPQPRPVLALPGPAQHPGHARYEAVKLRRLQAQRSASHRVAKRLDRAGARDDGREDVAVGASTAAAASESAPETRLTLLMQSFGIQAEVALSSKETSTVVIIPATVGADELSRLAVAVPWELVRESEAAGALGAFHTLASASGIVGVAAVPTPGSDRVGGIALACSSGTAKLPSAAEDLDLGSQIDTILQSHGSEGADRRAPPTALVALTADWWEQAASGAPASATTAAARRGVDPTGDRDTTHVLAGVLLDAAIVKASTDVGTLCALLSADVGQHVVNALDTAIGQVPPSGGVGEGVAKALSDAATNALVAEEWRPADRQTKALAQAASQLLTLATVPTDWASHAQDAPPLTVAPWFATCRSCGQQGHFAIDCG